MRAARSARASIATARMRGVSQHPLDRHRAGARADVPEQLAAARRKRRQRQRADLALGDLAVVLEQRVGRPGASGRIARARRGLDLEGDDIERVDRAEVEAVGARAADALARAA